MKKNLKISLILSISVFLLLSLTGCGKKEDVLIVGEGYICEITFENGNTKKTNWIVESLYEAKEMEKEAREEGIDVVRNENIVTMDFADIGRNTFESEKLTRTELISSMKDNDIPFIEMGKGKNDAILISSGLIEISFKKGKMEKVEFIITDSGFFLGSSKKDNITEILGNDVEIKQEGDILFVTMSLSQFNQLLEANNEDTVKENATKEDVIKLLEKSGYVVYR